MKTCPRTRKAKELPRYEKADVVGNPERNIVLVQLKKRNTRVALKNVKRPRLVVLDNAADPSRSRIQSRDPKSRAKSGNSSVEDRTSSDQE